MSKKLEGKIALVTGGSSGIGLATAKRFVAEGAHVYITGRRKAAPRSGARHYLPGYARCEQCTSGGSTYTQWTRADCAG